MGAKKHKTTKLETTVSMIKSWQKDFSEWITTNGGLKSAAPAEVKQAVFMSRAREVHGNKYSYLKANYTKAKDKVTITCLEHGEFEQDAFSHLQGMGCPKCVGKGLSTDEVIAEFIKVHGSIYDYSQVNYINVAKKVVISCPEHGEFEQLPAVHKRGNGCPKCGNEITRQARRLTQEEVIKQFRNKHGDLYDYSKVRYVNGRTKVTIICSIHGEFEQSPADHKASGCLRCGGRFKMTTSEIVEQFKVIHGNEYDYSKVNYVNNSAKVTIICSKHGEFKQSPNKHKFGQGCPKCIGKGLSTGEVIAEFIKVHGNRYGYHKVVYTGTTNKVIINCRVHGDFQQTPHKHRQGDGCPGCGTTSANMNQPARLYVLVSDCGSMMKIGITSEARVHGDRFTENQKNVDFDIYKLEDFLFMSGYECYAAEQELLSKSEKIQIEQKDGSISKEWVVFDGGIIELARNIHKHRGLIEESNHRPEEYLCDTHGVYLETPYNIMLGKGCSECEKEYKALNDPRRLTHQQVIEAFWETHGDRYDYSEVDYKGALEKVKIICRKHGSFMQKPGAHKEGSNCPKCAYENRPKTKTVITTESLVNQFEVVHGDKYDYSLVDYIDYRTKVIIICPKHGKFEQSPSSHKSGSGCKKCGIESRITANTQGWEVVLSKFRKVHGNHYDYSKVKYVDAITNITIICPKHDEFQQTPLDHYNGKRCLRCTYDKRNQARTTPWADVLVKFKHVHGTKYNYSDAIYVNLATPITIICPKHGEFKQKPSAHKQGQGCKNCGYERNTQNKVY